MMRHLAALALGAILTASGAPALATTPASVPVASVGSLAPSKGSFRSNGPVVTVKSKKTGNLIQGQVLKSGQLWGYKRGALTSGKTWQRSCTPGKHYWDKAGKSYSFRVVFHCSTLYYTNGKNVHTTETLRTGALPLPPR